jgi:2EXR family
MSARTSIHCNQRVMASGLQPTDLASFTLFPKLPEELRCMIWARSAPLRPRVIQLFYEATSNTWHACPDSCGGLPPIIHVSQQARKEALKGYTWAFDTYIDLEDDTIFISDPVFTLREPQRAFLNTEHARAMKKFALSSGVYEGLEEVAAAYPTLCLPFPAVLRKLEELTHFTLAISDDGELTAYDYDPEHASNEGYDFTDEEDIEHESEAEDITAIGPNKTNDEEDVGHESEAEDITAMGPNQTHHEEDGGNESEAEDIAAIGPDQTHSGDSVVNKAYDSQLLARLEELAFKNMSKGFVRERGNIHFENARTSVDHWEEWGDYVYCMMDHYDEEKKTHPDWVRPKVSIMTLRYGLNRLGDYGGPIHLAGDYADIVLEQEIEYSFDSDSMDDVDDFGQVWH